MKRSSFFTVLSWVFLTCQWVIHHVTLPLETNALVSLATDIPIRQTHTKTHVYADIHHPSPATPFTPFHLTIYIKFNIFGRLCAAKQIQWKCYVVERCYVSVQKELFVHIRWCWHTPHSLDFFDPTYLIFSFHPVPNLLSFELYLLHSVSLSICAAR